VSRNSNVTSGRPPERPAAAADGPGVFPANLAGLSDPQTEELMDKSHAVREFLGSDAVGDVPLDETTVLRPSKINCAQSNTGLSKSLLSHQRSERSEVLISRGKKEQGARNKDFSLQLPPLHNRCTQRK